jgi:hypothetical protein
MKQSERFALHEWLSEFPDDKTYDEIIGMLTGAEEVWVQDGITVWEVVEHHTLEQVADLIENTRMHFEHMTEDLVSALQGAVRLAQENSRAIVDDEDYADCLNGLQVILTQWEEK